MTLKTSLTNVFSLKFKQNLWLFSIITLAFFFVMPLPTLMDITHSDEILMHNPFNAMLIIGFGFLIPIVLFRYLNSKSEVDFYHSLPIKRYKYFIGNYVLGLAMFIIPFTFFYILTMPLVEHLSSNVFIAFIHMIISFFAIYSVTVLSMIITGNLFMGASLAFVLNFVVIAAYFVFTFLIDTLLFTYTSNYNYYYEITQYTSPISNIFNSIFNTPERYIIPMLLIGVVSTILAFVLYLKRPSENTSQAVAIHIFKPFIKYMCLTVGSLLFGVLFASITWSFSWLVFGIIISAIIISCVFEAIYEADFKACFKNIQYLGIYLVVSLAFVFGLRFDVLGYDSKVPTLEQVESITIGDVSYRYSDNTATISDPENLEYLLSHINTSVSRINRYDLGSSHWLKFDVKYTLKNGSSYTRQYDAELESEFRTNDLLNVLLSKEYVFAINNYANMDFYREQLDNVDSFQVQIAGNTDGHNINDSYGENELEMLLNLIEEDSKKLTDEYLKENLPIGSINFQTQFSYDNYIVSIYDNFDKTRDFIEEKDLNGFTRELHYWSKDVESIDLSRMVQGRKSSITITENFDEILNNMIFIRNDFLNLSPYSENPNLVHVFLRAPEDSDSRYYETDGYISKELANKYFNS